MTNKPQSENKTIEQIADDLSWEYAPAHDNPTEAGSLMRLAVRSGFKAGYLKALALSEKRAAGLVEALEIAADRLLGVSLAIKEHDTNINPQFFIERCEKFARDSREALSKYRSEG